MHLNLVVVCTPWIKPLLVGDSLFACAVSWSKADCCQKKSLPRFVRVVYVFAVVLNHHISQLARVQVFFTTDVEDVEEDDDFSLGKTRIHRYDCSIIFGRHSPIASYLRFRLVSSQPWPFMPAWPSYPHVSSKPHFLLKRWLWRSEDAAEAVGF